MTIYIPEDKISEIKNTANIVEVVSEVVLLKKTGDSDAALISMQQAIKIAQPSGFIKL